MSITFEIIYDALYYRWEGEGVKEIGVDDKTGIVRVKVNPKYYRPTEVVSTSLILNTQILNCAGISMTTFG